jgi:hypothetical protein
MGEFFSRGKEGHFQEKRSQLEEIKSQFEEKCNHVFQYAMEWKVSSS